MKKHNIHLVAIVLLGAACALTSCGGQNSTAKRSRLTAAFMTTNSSATYGDPPTVENIRPAQEADEHWRTYHYGWYGNP